MSVTSEQGQEQARTLVAALAAAEAEFMAVVPDATNPHFGNRYATLGNLIACTRPALSRHGLVITQTLEAHEAGAVALVTTLRHGSGESIVSTFPLPPWKGPQDLGSLLTYLRRYTYGAIVNVASEADDDANGAEHGARAARRDEKGLHDRTAAYLARKPRKPAERDTARSSPSPQIMPPDTVPDPDLAGMLADSIDNAHDLARLDALVPSLAALPAELRPPLRRRFSDRRKALQEIAQDIADLDGV